MVFATTSYLRLVHGWDAQTALFGASPGALAQVMLLATEYGADLRAIAIVQVVRVVALTIGIPAGLAYFGLTTQGVFLPPSGSIVSFTELAILVAVSTASAMLLRYLGFPGGLLFGSMLGSAVLHGSGFIHAVLPWWVVAAAVISIGAVTGSRFANTDPRTLIRYLGAALGSFTVAIAVASLFVFLLTTLLQVRVADAVAAFSPGALDTMMVLALALHLDPIFIGAHHVARFLLVSLSLPVLAHRLRGARVRVVGRPTAPVKRPTIED
jgi:membrane AbrB-like protein